ncbi:alpha/beta hydrolase-fold protein [Limnovirga soli]|uniref:Alpha/beta hydrolase n=1 Tax=Limnovirga soli TaxID=2656915 RepID=A0A8J8JXY0_9BACT|nr:alpha/beta hydrolase-fold protein [Limnovirga soli]NNV56781.1 alpha/beta hydrolase [Limnovirga soli]
MKFVLFVLLFVLLAFKIQAQQENSIVIGKVDSVYSRILNEQRKIWVYVPDMRGGMHAPNQKYPVVYLLDGDGHFESVVGMIQQLSEVNGNTVVPEMIVVGIPNTDRTRDLTPTHIDSDLPMMDSGFSRTTGGNENFISFIEKELMPHIDSAYPTQPYKTLIGHSFGGLTVMNVLTNHTKLFNAYIAIDPSMWYDKERFLQATKQKLTAKKYDGTRLYLGIANTMPEGMTLDKMKKDTSVDTRHIRSIFAMDQFIKSNSANGLTYASKYYADDDHGSVPLISEYDGLRSIFNYYRFKFTQADFTDSSTALPTRLAKHYTTISKAFGYTVSPPEMQINGLGYQALSLGQYTKAAVLFQMNIANYPSSGNALDSYGDLLAAKKDTLNAIAYYEKALAINSNEETKQKLLQLQGKAAFTISAQDLQKYVAAFEFTDVPATATTAIKDNALFATVPGQGSFELVPVATDTFKIKGLEGFKIHFEMDGNTVIGLTSIQANGTYKAKVKK